MRGLCVCETKTDMVSGKCGKVIRVKIMSKSKTTTKLRLGLKAVAFYPNSAQERGMSILQKAVPLESAFISHTSQ